MYLGDIPAYQTATNGLYAYVILLRIGFAPACCCHHASCALTARFHPYLFSKAVIFCGTFHRLTPPWISQVSCSFGVRTFLITCKQEMRLSALPYCKNFIMIGTTSIVTQILLIVKQAKQAIPIKSIPKTIAKAD